MLRLIPRFYKTDFTTVLCQDSVGDTPEFVFVIFINLRLGEGAMGSMGVSNPHFALFWAGSAGMAACSQFALSHGRLSVLEPFQRFREHLPPEQGFMSCIVVEFGIGSGCGRLPKCSVPSAGHPAPMCFIRRVMVCLPCPLITSTLSPCGS